MCDTSSDNPFCLLRKPTDPYHWRLYNSIWYYAQYFDSSTTSQSHAMYIYEGQFYLCTSEAGCTSVPGSSASEWLLIKDDENNSFVYAAECPANSAPKPNARTGACEKTSLNDPCSNPCIRLENGSLAVNGNSGQCRVFPNVTEGGNALQNNKSCPTVCPNACVELWETCPPGTGPLTTLLQTKSSIDLMSLTGPYLQNGRTNPLWPTNYVNKKNSQPKAEAILGKPYTECYSYNTEFCDLPMAWQKSVVTSVLPLTVQTQCFSSCPQGTYPDLSDPSTCLFMPIEPTQTSAIGPETPVQKVFCNPQYFNPVYWTESGFGGVQKGCQARGLPSKQGSSCTQGTSPVVNEFFNLEWCIPDCPQGYFFDLSQSTCISTCQGTDPMNQYSTYLDYVDFYATSNRCANGNNCIQNNTSGRCPLAQNKQNNSRIFAYNTETTQAENIPIRASSINTQCPLQKHAVTVAKVSAVQDPSSNILGECPSGMKFGATACKELQNLCYDECQKGYEPVTFCDNGQQQCAPENLIYACRAQCPSHNEGLGPWREINSDPIFTCAFNYPGNVAPADPNLWVQCPDDGRYFNLQSTASNDTVLSTAARQESLCIRKTYLRRVTCPFGYTESGNECISACDSGDILVQKADGEYVCQGTNIDSSRHDLDLAALSDTTHAKEAFQKHVLLRKGFSRGLGSDPNSGLNSEMSKLDTAQTIIISIIAAIVVLIASHLLKFLF